MKSLFCIFLLAGATIAFAQREGPLLDADAVKAQRAQGHGMSNPAEAPQPDPYKQPPQRILKANPEVVTKIAKLLPSGMTPQQACEGFKRMGDCGAAIHAAQNLGIPFADLKSRLTAEDAPALDKLIQELKPDVKAKAEAKKAEKQADKDLWDARVI